MSAPWTPGPWKSAIEPAHYPESDDADLPGYVRDSAGREIAYIAERYGLNVNYEADMRLIQHAPEMAEALETIVNVFPHFNRDHYPEIGEAFDRARALLSRIRGETP